MEVRLLGSVELSVDERRVVVGRPQLRLLVAALCWDLPAPVPVDVLLGRMWDEPPTGARDTLHVLLSQLRRLLRATDLPEAIVPLVRTGGGYALQLDPEGVDALRLQRLAARARAGDRTAGERLALLREAMSLWRGEPLPGLRGQWVARVRQGLREQYLDVAVAWARAELDGGDPAAVVGRLIDVMAEHPLTEPVAEALMRALVATGRAAEALALYETTRRRLVDELGADPGTALQALHRQILLGAPTAATRAEPRTVPRQLPLAPADFTGRIAELAAMTELLNRHARGATVLVAAISGTAGVGKTALAVRWAHQVLARFPDGQLYVNLRGYDPAGPPLEPAAVIRMMLTALGVEPRRIAGDLAALTTAYRSELAGRRALVMLDNARDSEQVRPLLPGAPGSAALVTSRSRLVGLVARDGADPITLELLSRPEARQLLARRLPPDQLAAEPDALEAILDRCAGLPLALSIVAARITTSSRPALATIAAELREPGGRLDALRTGDPATDLTAVFSWSYQSVTQDAARLFRNLGVHPGPDLTADAAASLDGRPDQARVLLAELAAANLVIEHAPMRYTLHDLLRAYARDLSNMVDSGPERRAVTHRMLDHYLHSAYAADRLLNPGRDTIALDTPLPGATPEHHAGPTQALAWLAAEHEVLLACLRHAATTGFDAHTWHLAWSLYDYLDRSGHWHERIDAGHLAVTAAQKLGDTTAEARSLRNLAAAHTRLGGFDEAHTHLRRALALTEECNDRAGQAHTHISLAYLYGWQDRLADSLEHARQALAGYRAIGHQAGQARALNAVGWTCAQLGDHQQALVACQQALDLHMDRSDRPGQAATWDSLGYANHRLGDHAQAITCYQQARRLFRELGDRYYEADTMTRLGDTYKAAGDHAAARATWQQALAALDELRHPNAEQVRSKLTSLRPSQPDR